MSATSSPSWGCRAAPRPRCMPSVPVWFRRLQQISENKNHLSQKRGRTMHATIQEALLDVFQRVNEDPDHVPAIPIAAWPEDSEQGLLLTSFRAMLHRLQQRQQEKLEMQERFSLAVQAANDGLWVQHLHTNEAHFSPRWKSMLGYEDHEIDDTVEEWRSRLHPDDVERVLAVGREHLEMQQDSYEIDYRLRHKDGSYHWMLSLVMRLRDANGRAYRLAGSNTDI